MPSSTSGGRWISPRPTWIDTRVCSFGDSNARSRPPGEAGRTCQGLFVWHVKPVGASVALYDPVVFHGRCEGEAPRYEALVARLQEEFKQRWLALVGPVPIAGPTPKTHSSRLVAEVLVRLIREPSDQPVSPPR